MGGYLLRHITTTRAPKKIARSDNPNSTTRNGVTSGCAVATGTWVGCGARQVMHALGHSGNKVLLRVIGLIVMAIAVEFFLNRS